MMALPKGALRPLAKVAGPVLLWMSAGWAAYPTMIERISEAMGESVDMPEVRLFSTAMTACCMICGILLILYGFIGPGPRGTEFRTSDPRLCPYCGREMASDTCHGCGKSLLR